MIILVVALDYVDSKVSFAYLPVFLSFFLKFLLFEDKNFSQLSGRGLTGHKEFWIM